MTATLDAASRRVEPDPPGAPWRERILPPLGGRGGWTACLLIALLGGLLRFVRLGQPTGRIFDEVYYACDAQNLLRFGVEVATRTDPDDPLVAARCEPTGQPGFIVHPPLGKWAIALGLRLFGVDEIGWRVAAAVAGTLMILALVRVTRRMTGSTILGCLAGLLLSVDGLHFVQSRVAMLDIFLAMWVLLAFACLVTDRDAVRTRLSRTARAALGGGGPGLGWRPWRLLAGLCLGAGVATKWSALFAVAALGLLSFAWEVGARRTAGVRAPVRATLRRSVPASLGVLVVLPAVLYVASWAGWFVSDDGYDRQWAAGNPASGFGGVVPGALRSWWQYHREIFAFHDTLSQAHDYQSHPAGWLLLARPVSYYYPAGLTRGQFGCAADSCSREVLAIGTPVLWWGFALAAFALLWMWAVTRDWRAGAVLAMVATTILPWVRDDLHGRTMFLFYALPAVPFMCLGLALVAGWALGGPHAPPRRRRCGTALVGLFTAAVVVNFGYFYAVLAAQTLPYAEWADRMWFSSWI